MLEEDRGDGEVGHGDVSGGEEKYLKGIKEEQGNVGSAGLGKRD